MIAVQSHTRLGQYNVVALNRGTAAGLEAGTVLAVFQSGDVVRDSFSKGGLAASKPMFSTGGRKVQLP